MKLSVLERYEIQAEAFRRMTGHLAPGKDAPLGAYGDMDERTKIYLRWAEIHGEAVYAVLDAVDCVMRTSEDDEADDLIPLMTVGNLLTAIRHGTGFSRRE